MYSTFGNGGGGDWMEQLTTQSLETRGFSMRVESHVVPCVSLCEAVAPCSTVDELVELMGATCIEAGFPHVERVYVGSYFCENYFLNLSERFHEMIRDLCERFELSATLAVPVFGQSHLDRGKRRIARLLDRFSDVYDEIVVNDVAAFHDLAGATGLRLGLGRLFAKELRDVRYPGRFAETSRPSVSSEAASCLRAPQAFAPLIEVDPASAIVDVSRLRRDAARLAGCEAEIAVHLPLCYATTGRICSASCAEAPDHEKFRLGRDCHLECLRLVQGSRVDEGIRYVKHGRTYYFENAACQISGVERWRVVYAARCESMR